MSKCLFFNSIFSSFITHTRTHTHPSNILLYIYMNFIWLWNVVPNTDKKKTMMMMMKNEIFVRRYFDYLGEWITSQFSAFGILRRQCVAHTFVFLFNRFSSHDNGSYYRTFPISTSNLTNISLFYLRNIICIIIQI